MLAAGERDLESTTETPRKDRAGGGSFRRIAFGVGVFDRSSKFKAEVGIARVLAW
jgi:hypothetical protein